MKEHQVQRQILDWLKVKRIFHWRNNTGSMAGSHKGKRWFMRFGAVGSPDIFALDRSLLVGIEVKGEKGKLSEDQEKWRKEFKQAGGLYILARSLDDVTQFWES